MAAELVLSQQESILFLSATDIGAPGHLIPAHWSPALGATKAEVTTASVTLIPGVAEEVHRGVPSRKDGSGWVIDIPAKKRLKSLSLGGFKQSDGTSLTSIPGGSRIAVAFPPAQGGGFDSPRFAVPAIGRQGSVPPHLTGASYSNGVLRINPAVAAAKVRISLVTGDNPLQFAEQDTQLGDVDATTSTPAQNAKVTAPDGSAVWQTPVFEPDGPSATTDLRKAFEAALNARLAAKAAPAVDITVTADAPAKAVVSVAGPRGALLRIEKGVKRTTLEGDPVAIDLAPPLASETPASVTGDLTIKYSGIRILEEISDPLPGAGDAFSGTIVGAAGSVRTLSPQALDGMKPARVGIFGRAKEDCELAIEFVRQVGPSTAEPVVSPAVIPLKASHVFQTYWAPLPAGTQISGAVGVRVRANRGTFFWVNDSAGQGLVRIAIFDPSPGGRPLMLGAALLTTVGDTAADHKQFAFPAAPFQGNAPALSSNLFLVVDCSDLTLRYGR